MLVLYVIRRERDRDRIESLLGFSSKTVVWMYVTLGLTVGTGLWMGFVVPGFFGQAWYWLSLGLLVVLTVVMWVMARPHGKRIRAACEIRPSGVPRVSDAELEELLLSPRTHLITTIGVVGLGLLLYLMVFRPAF